jgi:UDP-galactopyranose mutase
MHQLFGVTTPAAARAALDAERQPCADPRNMEEFCLAAIGPTLYETFIKGYTIKQWGRLPRDLPADIIKRLPVRFDFNDNYFSDRHQGIPVDGYTAMVERMLGATPVELGVDFLADRDRWQATADLVIYTGSIDSWFGNIHGPLEYRSLRFERELLDIPDFQGNAVVNYVDADVPFTRILEHRHFDMKQGGDKTLITREYPAEWEPGQIEYYPVNDAANMAKFRQYRALADGLAGSVHFGGRLGEYRYYDMHQVIGAALAFCGRLIDRTEETA